MAASKPAAAPSAHAAAASRLIPSCRLLIAPTSMARLARGPVDLRAPRKVDLSRAHDLDGGAACWLYSEGQEWGSLVSSISASAIAVSMPRRTRWLS